MKAIGAWTQICIGDLPRCHDAAPVAVRVIQFVAKSRAFWSRKTGACKVEGDALAASSYLWRCFQIDALSAGQGRFESYCHRWRITEGNLRINHSDPMIQRNPNAAKVVGYYRPVTIDSLCPEKPVFLAIALHIRIAERIGHEMFPVDSQYLVGSGDPEGSTPILGDTVD